MHLSYSRVIKSTDVRENGDTAIDVNIPIEIETDEEKLEKLEGNFLEEYASVKRMTEQILQNGRAEASRILDAAKVEKLRLEYEAKEKGFKQGYDEGHEIGLKEGNEKGYNEGCERGKEIIANANYVLFQAKEEYDKYLESKQLELRNIIVSSVESMLRKEFENEDALDKLLQTILEEEKNNKMFIVRSSPEYGQHLSEVIEEFKANSAFKGEIVLLEDKNLQKGNLVVEKDNGKTSFIAEDSIEKLKEVLMEE